MRPLCREDRTSRKAFKALALLRLRSSDVDSFPEASPLQKQSALAAACSLAEQITRTVEAEPALRVGRIEPGLTGAGRPRHGAARPRRRERGCDPGCQPP